MLSKKTICLLSVTLLITSALNNVKAEEIKKPASKPTKISGNSLAIAAVVNDQAISSFDVENRMKFIFATTRMSNTPDMIANIKPQVIRTLIDEKLQLQEAEKNNVTVDDNEVTQAIAGIEAQRGMPAGSITKMLASNNVPIQTFNDQIRAQLSWSKLLGKTVRGRIKIGDDEIAIAQKNANLIEKQTAPKAEEIKIREVEIAVINLPIEKREQEKELKKMVEKLYGELRNGASFEEVARQFSANSDGKSFWIRPEQLDANIAKILRSTNEGSVTPPVRTSSGFSIIKLLHVRADKIEKKKEKEQDNKETPTPQNTENMAREYLFRQKFELEAQKYIRNLRRQAFIDIR